MHTLKMSPKTCFEYIQRNQRHPVKERIKLIDREEIEGSSAGGRTVGGVSSRRGARTEL